MLSKNTKTNQVISAPLPPMPPSKNTKTNETKFEINIKKITGKTKKNDAVNSIINIREVDLHGESRQCVCGTWCTSKINIYQVLNKPNSAIMIGNACRDKYLKKKKRRVCKNINRNLLKKVVNEGEKNINLDLHQINSWDFLVKLGEQLDISPMDITKDMAIIEKTLNEQDCIIEARLREHFNICRLKQSKFYRKQERFENRTFIDHQILIAKHYNLTEEFNKGYFKLWIKNKKLNNKYETEYEFEFKIKKFKNKEISRRIYKILTK